MIGLACNALGNHEDANLVGQADGASPDAPADVSAPVDAGSVRDAAGCNDDLSTSKTSCGRCSHDCLGGECRGGICQPVRLATGQDYPTPIAVDGDYVYWGTRGDNNYEYRLMRIRKDGTCSGLSCPEQILDESSGRTHAIIAVAVRGKTLFWANLYDLSSAPDGGFDVLSVDTDEALLREHGTSGVVTPIANTIGPQSLALGPGSPFLYWGNAYDTRTVMRYRFSDASAGDNFEVVANHPPLGSNSARTIALAVDQKYVYWGNLSDGTVYKKVLDSPACMETLPEADGGCPVLMAADGHHVPMTLALQGANIYMIYTPQGADLAAERQVLKVPTDGSRPTTLAVNQAGATGVVTDGVNTYWANGDGTIRSTSVNAMTPCDGDACYVMARGTPLPNQVVVDDVAVYWTSQRDGEWQRGSIWKVAK